MFLNLSGKKESDDYREREILGGALLHHHHSLSRHNSSHHHHHRSSMDSVFVDLDLSTGSAGDFLGSSSVLTPGSGGDGGIVDLRALAKDRQKKDNHNMSKLHHHHFRRASIIDVFIF